MKKFDQSREIALFIDKLRAYRNIPQEDFLHEIISMRQYRRYMSGDSTLSYLILDKLSKRLGFDAEFVIMELETEKIKQTQSVINLYNAVITNNFDKANSLFMSIDDRHLISENDRLLFEHSKNYFDYKKGYASQLVTINRTKKLINYESLLKKKVLSTSELLILVSFFRFDSFKEIHIIAEKLASYTENQITVVSGHNIRVIALVLEQLSKYFSIKENYDRMLYYATEGIRYSILMRSFYLLDNLYYMAGYSCDKLNQMEKRNEYFYKCLSLLNVEGDKEKTAKFKSIFENRFNIDISDFLRNYFQISNK